ncbi:MAG TPA: chemotaxis protein CheD [Noviherbaspirillum sp.]
MSTASASNIDVFLQPGEYFVGDERHVLRTLLGSCVSITLWHPARRIGVMSHFLLPTRGTSPAIGLDARYGDEAMQLMLEELRRNKVHPPECVAKIFGGANMFPGQRQSDTVCVGRKNGAAARALLRANGINIASENLFGVGHRQIIFNVRTGDVWARQARLADAAGLEQR